MNMDFFILIKNPALPNKTFYMR